MCPLYKATEKNLFTKFIFICNNCVNHSNRFMLQEHSAGLPQERCRLRSLRNYISLFAPSNIMGHIWPAHSKVFISRALPFSVSKIQRWTLLIGICPTIHKCTEKNPQTCNLQMHRPKEKQQQQKKLIHSHFQNCMHCMPIHQYKSEM